jgi:hypothetical protein
MVELIFLKEQKAMSLINYQYQQEQRQNAIDALRLAKEQERIKNKQNGKL